MAYVFVFIIAASLCFFSVGVAGVIQIALFFAASALPVLGLIINIKKGKGDLRDALFLQSFSACAAIACFLWPIKFPPVLGSFESWWAVSLGYAGLTLLFQWTFCENQALNALGPVKQCSVILLLAVASEWQAMRVLENVILQSEIVAMAVIASFSFYLVHKRIRQYDARN